MFNRDFHAALTSASTAITLDPTATYFWIGRGHVHFCMGNFAAARTDYATALQRQIELFPSLCYYFACNKLGEKSSDQLRGHALSLSAEKWPKLLVDLFLNVITPVEFQSAAKAAGATALAHYYLGQWHLLNGSAAEAKAQFRDALDFCAIQHLERAFAASELEWLAPTST